MSAYDVFDLIKYCFFGAPKNALKWRLCPLSDWNSNTSNETQTEDEKNTFKISVVGETEVGSTSICKRFMHDEINKEVVPSMGPDCWVKEIDVDNQTVNLQIWNIRGFGYSVGKDISLELDWKPIKDYVCKRAHIVILVYDVTSMKTFKNLKTYLEYLNLDRCIIKILVGNKIDLKERKVVSTEEAQSFAQKNQMRLFETSALQNLNIDEVFENGPYMLLKRRNGF
jgi:small GTP-binding protein